MERELFTWEGWDQVDTACFKFNQCILVRDIGKFKPGDAIDCIVVDYDCGVMGFYDDDGTDYATFKLGLVVLPE